jgi:hydroxyethylthiazole kinase-like uncharacterized protein yjeF
VHAVLSTAQMYEADHLTIKSGLSGIELMENAGTAVTAHITAHWDACKTLVLCGPGNNGGDGYVVARQLSEAGWDVDVAQYGAVEKLSADAKHMRGQLGSVSSVGDMASVPVSDFDLIVDAIFGAGFRGTLPPEISTVFECAAEADVPIVAIDVPSGVDGDTGKISSGTPMASMTVSFFKAKLGHLLYPGRENCGRLEIADIGIPEHVLDELAVDVFENSLELWRSFYPQPSATGHKYNRGHAVIVGGGVSNTGAARISARNALRVGAGAVTLLCPASALMIYAQAMEAVMVSSFQNSEDLNKFVKSKRIASLLIGPANGVNDITRQNVMAVLATDANIIIDADAISVFKDNPQELFTAIKSKMTGQVVLTPHEAEFNRLFDIEGTRVDRCRSAANASGATVILKGATTCIASPSGSVVLNTHASPWLATAGSGDALAGILCGLMASMNDGLKASAAAVWLHGEAGVRLGAGMTAEDIEKTLPSILSDII